MYADCCVRTSKYKFERETHANFIDYRDRVTVTVCVHNAYMHTYIHTHVCE